MGISLTLKNPGFPIQWRQDSTKFRLAMDEDKTHWRKWHLLFNRPQTKRERRESPLWPLLLDFTIRRLKEDKETEIEREEIDGL